MGVIVTGADYVALGIVALLVLAVVLGRRKGKANFAAAVAQARVDGRAEAISEAHSVSSATVNQIAGVDPDVLAAALARALDERRTLDLGRINHDNHHDAAADHQRRLDRSVVRDGHIVESGRTLGLPDGARREPVPAEHERAGLRGGVVRGDDPVSAHPARWPADVNGEPYGD